MGGLAGGDAGGLFSSLTDLLQRSASNPTYVDASVSTETSGQLFARLFSGDGIVAQRSGVMDQLAAAIEESRTLLASNHWDDLFGGALGVDAIKLPALWCLLTFGWRVPDQQCPTSPPTLPLQAWSWDSSSAATRECCSPCWQRQR